MKENAEKKSQDLFDINQVSEYFGFSESTTRRKVRESRDGKGNFPLPLFKSGCRVLWRKADILAWAGEDGDVITYSPPPVPPPKAPLATDAKVRRGLARFGINLPTEPETN